MYSTRQILNRIFFALMIINCSVNAALKYQQEVTISSFSSEKETKEMVSKFCQAAKDDPDLKVIDVRFEQKKLSDNFISYDGIIKCHVSKIDKDLFRIQEKMIQNDEILRKSKVNKDLLQYP
jgi:hypothetical protein